VKASGGKKIEFASKNIWLIYSRYSADLNVERDVRERGMQQIMYYLLNMIKGGARKETIHNEILMTT